MAVTGAALATQTTACRDVIDPTIASRGGLSVKTTDDELRFIGYTRDVPPALGRNHAWR
jgi:hypothetical protein